MKIPVSGPKDHKRDRCWLCQISQNGVDRVFLYQMTHAGPDFNESIERLLDLFAGPLPRRG